MRRWDVFALGRMRHLDLLALLFELDGHPATAPHSQLPLGKLTKNQVAALILTSPA